ncbi:hypothetical protein K469DRAFT_640198, partial [Zopfia rhizophila CBS 207.26]
MSFLRTSRTIFHPISPAFRSYFLLQYRQSLYQLPARLQIRAKSKQASLNASSEPSGSQPGPKTLPQSPIKADSSLQEPRETGPTTQEVQFASNKGEYEYTAKDARRRLDAVPRFKVNYLRPIIWALGFSSGIYVCFAYLDDGKNFKPSEPKYQHRPRPDPASQPTGLDIAQIQRVLTAHWNHLDPISKLSTGIIATNVLVQSTSFLPYELLDNLMHVPARNVNFTLLTSAFTHSGLLHLGVNMYFCSMFFPPVGYSPLFEGNTYHMLSFYLSAAVLSSYAQHLSTIFSSYAGVVPSVFIRSTGASGALFAVFGAYCMQYPTHPVGIMFLPFSFDAQTFLPCVMLFDLYGMVFGFKTIRFGHAAHLGGALFGVAYSYFDGKNNLWIPLTRFFRNIRKNQSP